MTIDRYVLTLPALLVGSATILWLIAMLVAIVSWERRRGRLLRTSDVFALLATLAFAGAWAYAFWPQLAAPRVEARNVNSCQLANVGDTEEQVKARLGEPDEIRGEEETRGPGANVWIYRQSLPRPLLRRGVGAIPAHVMNVSSSYELAQSHHTRHSV